MKKLLAMALCVITGVVMASTDVYDFKLAGKVPYLSKGIRTYKTQTMTGKLYLTWGDDGLLTEAYAEVQNKSTKVKHTIDFTKSMYNLMGKASKKISKTVPTFILESDSDTIECTVSEAHETIKYIMLAGTGSLTFVKGSGCGYCGDATNDCNKIGKLSGNFTGIMDCECPEESDWNHTLQAQQCGIYVDEDGNTVRSHDAAYWGSWTATYNKKATAAYAN